MHETTMKMIDTVIRVLTERDSFWEDHGKGWNFSLSMDNSNPDWPSKKWFLIGRENHGTGKGSLALHGDFGDSGPGDGYTMSVYLLMDMTRGEIITRINKPDFREELYRELEDLEQRIRKHDSY